MAFLKDPDSTLDFTFDWSDWLGTGESIASQTVTVDGGVTKESVAASSTAVTVWVSGGTAGESYQVRCKITTDNTPARIDERTIIIEVKHR